MITMTIIALKVIAALVAMCGAGIAVDLMLDATRIRRSKRDAMAEYYVRNMPLRRD